MNAMKKSEQNLSSMFKNVMLLSGTPDFNQRKLAEDNADNVCSCTPREAMANGWICRPTLNLVDCSKSEWPSAIRNVLYREIKIWNDGSRIFKPTILVNCGSIDDIKNLREVPWFKDNAGKKFHFISIHSSKRAKCEDGTVVDITAEIDGESCKSSEAYEKIEQIDSNCFHDDLPIIVAQVEMIGEGINVSSFNAVVTASSSDKTAMQQIGRAVRNYKVTKQIVEDQEAPSHPKSLCFLSKLFSKKSAKPKQAKKMHVFTKVNDGHANVYVIKDNIDSLYSLIANLESSYSLTDSCFSWGDKIDMHNGSSPEVLEEAEWCKLAGCHWEKIDDSDPEIIEIINRSRDIIFENETSNWKNADVDGNGRPDGEDFKELAEKLNKSDYVKCLARRDCMQYDELYQYMMSYIKQQLKNEWNKKAWNIDRQKFLNMVFLGNDDVVSFFMTHMSEQMVKNLSK